MILEKVTENVTTLVLGNFLLEIYFMWFNEKLKIQFIKFDGYRISIQFGIIHSKCPFGRALTALTVSPVEEVCPHQKGCPVYDTKLNLMVRFQFWRSRERE